MFKMIGILIRRAAERLGAAITTVKGWIVAGGRRIRAFFHWLTRAIGGAASRTVAWLWARFYRVSDRTARARQRVKAIVVWGVLALLLGATFYEYSSLQSVCERIFTVGNRLSSLQSLLLTLGGALIGAAAIAFTLVMFAMQVNVERMPHGLFRRFSNDKGLLGAFVATFLLAIAVACTSLIPAPSWAAIALLASGWAAISIGLLWWYAYRRALLLINPLEQLRLVVDHGTRAMRVFVRRAKRIAPLIEAAQEQEENPIESPYDVTLMTFFQANPNWTAGAEQAIGHAVSFATRLAQLGDHETCNAALRAIVVVNRAYVKAKGRTFVAPAALPGIHIPLSTDAFLNQTLENLRQIVRAAVTRGDERQIEQTFRTFVELVGVYAQIDYPPHTDSKHHAQLVAGYLSTAVKDVIPHDRADVLMEGARLIGEAAAILLAYGPPMSIASLVDELGAVAAPGVLNQRYRPVTQVAIAQLATLTFSLLQSRSHNVDFVTGKIRDTVAMITKLFLQMPDNSLISAQSTYLGPYYSSTNSQALRARLTELVNALLEANENDTDARTVIRNIETWADGLYQTQKELLLLAIQKRSQFSGDMIHWIEGVAMLLLVVSTAPGCDGNTRDKLRRHSSWLISTFSWIPDDAETVAFVENHNVTEVLFRSALHAYTRQCCEYSKKVQDLLLDWGFQGGKHETGWAILEESLFGLATLALRTGNDQDLDDLKDAVARRVGEDGAPNHEIRNRTSDHIKERARTLHDPGHWSSLIEHEMSGTDHTRLRPLLEELAEIISPVITA